MVSRPIGFLQLTAILFALGITTYLEQYVFQAAFLIAAAGLGGLWLIGYFCGRPSPRARDARRLGRLAAGAFLGLLLVLVPPLFIYILSLTPAAIFAPKIQPRYFLLIFLPGYALLLALGVRWLARRHRALGLAALIAILGLQIPAFSTYYQSRKLRDDYFTLANTINAFAQPGDEVLIYTDHEWPTFLYYLRAPIAWAGVPNRPLDEEAAIGLASRSAYHSEAVWVVTIPEALNKDPQRLLPLWLAYARPLQFERPFGDYGLTLYAHAPRDFTEVPAENFAPQHTLSFPLTPDTRLLGYDLVTQEFRGGDTVRLVTY
jgi:hypothetical protein